VPNLIMHCNYFEGGYPVETTFDKAVEHGYDGVEMRGRPRDEAMSLDDYLNLVESEKRRTGLEVVLALHGNYMTDDAEARKAEVAHWSDVLKRGIDMGVTTYNAMCGGIRPEDFTGYEYDKCGSGAATEEHWKWATEAYQQLGAIAEAGGARLAFETHMVALTDTAAPTKKLLDMIDSPAVGANLDMGNIVLHPTGETLEEALEILAGKIYYTHLKNVYIVPGGGWICCHISDGVIDNYKFAEILKRQGYDGPLGLEAPRRGDRNHFAKVDCEYMRSVLADLDWD